MKITFWGATTEVTGSMHFVHMPEGLLVVDCGLTQGTSKTEKLNLISPPFKPSEIKAAILTHAHLDHCGYLPKLVKDGFHGPIYSTHATAKLARIILKDSASLDEMALYDEKDVDRTTDLFKPVDWDITYEVLGGSFSLVPAGHILGASSVRIKAQGKTAVFSGDLGRHNDPLIPPPPACAEADIVIMESTYGGKNRSGNLEKELHSFLMDISRGQRIGIVASFAVARGQLLLTLIHDFFKRHPEERFPVIMDSPMMSEANQVFKSFANLTLMPEELESALEKITSIEFPRQAQSLSHKKGPLLIISSSGMLTGGRIQRHLLNWQDDPSAILFLPGYQSEGTPGRAFIEGERAMTGMNGEKIEWKGEVRSSDAFSSHADHKELIEWTHLIRKNTKIFLVHGEKKSKELLKKSLLQHFDFVSIAERYESVII
jgi:metallo-beta-lactamase family protein